MSTELRYYEYYNMQETFDWLYQRSLENRTKGINLYNIIISERNILLAYRIIKSNTGSKTAGVDNQTISDYKMKNKAQFIREIRESLVDYKPEMVRRVEIPKPNGKTRPLGIPTMRDRLIQQMFKQVLEPICEAQFYKHSYGFRQNRSTEHAIARCNFVAYACKCHYVVDVDIEGFFDNVSHSKMIKQLYTIGIKDRRVLAIISKMLKAPIKGIGTLNKGTPQGAILSPLLSNVVLNDLDWWVANQWETFQSRYPYKDNAYMYNALKKTKLKEMHIVRYADDFKIFTNTPKSAIKIFHAVKGYLRNQLSLDISKEKSKITNLRKRYSEFLGFEIKVEKQRKGKYVSISRVSRKAKKKIKKDVRQRVKRIQRYPTFENIKNYNLFVRGIQNYYQKATRVNLDFSDIYYSCLPALFNRLKFIGKYEIPRSPPLVYKKIYSLNHRTFRVNGEYLYPIECIKWDKAWPFRPTVNNYTEQGRLERIKMLKPKIGSELIKMGQKYSENQSIEFLDNKLSRYSMQNGKCAVTGEFLTSEIAHGHHIVPKEQGGTDDYQNIVIVHEWIHKLIHAKTKQTIEEYFNVLQLNEKQLKKLNKYRKECNLAEIHLK
ncbi:group II intron reverse transcriptase/maturase [Enterococcus faecalis]|uniref:group II intron reverse transcriptase/maturase n=1 Tax=Enterococcus faecalis TaxID=1351 RepID=UPI00045B4366|nr:group II intron reverse transcriptase/maturase [Enterococcus faecalis]KAJ65534.1 Retron-type reverse transcriptase [Enterococcus faecalis KS19]